MRRQHGADGRGPLAAGYRTDGSHTARRSSREVIRAESASERHHVVWRLPIGPVLLDVRGIYLELFRPISTLVLKPRPITAGHTRMREVQAACRLESLSARPLRHSPENAQEDGTQPGGRAAQSARAMCNQSAKKRVR